MTRGKTGTNVLITKIEIIRGAATGIQTVETVTVKPANNFIYNLAGQRVDENYKVSSSRTAESMFRSNQRNKLLLLI